MPILRVQKLLAALAAVVLPLPVCLPAEAGE